MSYLTPSFNRLLANIRQAGWKRECLSAPSSVSLRALTTSTSYPALHAEAWRDYQYIGEPKFGKLVGQDE